MVAGLMRFYCTLIAGYSGLILIGEMTSSACLRKDIDVIWFVPAGGAFQDLHLFWLVIPILGKQVGCDFAQLQTCHPGSVCSSDF